MPEPLPVDFEAEDFGYYDQDDFEDEDERKLEEAAQECGWQEGQGCDLAGSEWCDWSCPFSDQMFREQQAEGGAA